MSTLTKILVVLLSFGAIFVCGISVSYVASTRNVVAQRDDYKSTVNTLESQLRQDKSIFNEKTAQMKEVVDALTASNAKLQEDVTRLESDWRSADREKNDYMTKYANLAASFAGLDTSVGSLRTDLQSTRTQLEDQLDANTKMQKYLNETTRELLDKTVQLEALEKTARRLLEEKTALEAGGVSVARVVTPLPNNAAKPVISAPTSQAIRGLITDISTNLVSVSVGTSDGVSKDMVFHVTRGDQFLCDIIITDVDTDKAAGVLELVRQQPKIGDHVSTEL